MKSGAFITDSLLEAWRKISPLSGTKDYETEIIATTPDISNIQEATVVISFDLDALSDGKGGKKHACGHSTNTEAGLEVAQMIMKHGIKKVALIFQPAEEGPGNKIDGYVHPSWYDGGLYLRKKWIYNEMNALIACHVDPSLQETQVRITPWVATAAGYRRELKAKGDETHAALPFHWRNPIRTIEDFLQARRIFNEKYINERTGEKVERMDDNYGLISIPEIQTEPGELNSIRSRATAVGICRVSGELALQEIQKVMHKFQATLTLEAPPITNDEYLVKIGREVAVENNYSVVSKKVDFLTGASRSPVVKLPRADPEKYPWGSKKSLQFFTPGGKNCWDLHGKNFRNTEEGAKHQITMLFGIVEKLSKEAK